MLDYAIITAAAFLAGVLNTIAGGGTFLTFPALVFAGLPPVAANATSAVAVFPGYFGGFLGFRREVATFDRKRLVSVTLFTAIGGLVGSALLLISSNEAFSVVIPFLLLGATLVFAFGQRMRDWAEGKARQITPEGRFGTVLVSIYGGYFNGGLGIVLLALFSLWGMKDLNQMNGLKTWLSFVLSAVSVAAFAIAGIVAWPQAIAMMIAATIGGYAGAPLARALPAVVVRTIIVAVGLTMSSIFFYRLA
ncbi:sulfite exporter TauE/SafE family protein [Oricola cellulosilytica]|uniref:Probable membrane transporter protein n=1 Tax=Oricola cellulosilytica TaxID=1429082 RepID=A0A4R0PCV9_9HYPH|nr:sulfite exporter TauE/SafE family protein [Oricola cellulosilytica]TCD14373.1 sulfite exporter TauE/SafE family protein [Oricola cellulosilytica]